MNPTASLLVGLGVGAVLVIGVAGCVQTRIVDNSFESFRRYADRNTKPEKGEGEDRIRLAGQRGMTWSIQLASFTGEGRQQRARELMSTLADQSRLSSLRLADRGGTTKLYQGKYRRRSTPAARAALSAVQRTSLDGKYRFRDARFVALTRQGRQIEDKYNLKAYRGSYTLQVAYYDRHWDGDRREAAERQAAAMREHFEMPAYYYHGPHRSMVTLRVFNEQQAFEMKLDPLSPGRAKVRTYAPNVKQLRHRFPRNFANKANIAQRFASDKKYENAQNSVLVRVP